MSIEVFVKMKVFKLNFSHMLMYVNKKTLMFQYYFLKYI